MSDVTPDDAWSEPVRDPAAAPVGRTLRPAGGWVAAVAALVAVGLGAGAGTALANHVPEGGGFPGGRRGFPPGIEVPPGFGPNGLGPNGFGPQGGATPPGGVPGGFPGGAPPGGPGAGA